MAETALYHGLASSTWTPICDRIAEVRPLTVRRLGAR